MAESSQAPDSGDARRINLESLFPDVRADTIDEGERLRLARQLLLFLGLLTVGIFIAYGRNPDNSALQAIFELFKIGLLPLITLIVSFYFSRMDH